MLWSNVWQIEPHNRFLTMPEVDDVVWYRGTQPMRVVSMGETENIKKGYVKSYLLLMDLDTGTFRPVWTDYFLLNYQTCEKDTDGKVIEESFKNGRIWESKNKLTN